jgi:hypothetical protein
VGIDVVGLKDGPVAVTNMVGANVPATIGGELTGERAGAEVTGATTGAELTGETLGKEVELVGPGVVVGANELVNDENEALVAMVGISVAVDPTVPT